MADAIWNGPVRLQSKNYPEHFIGVNPDKAVFMVNKGKRFELVSPGLTGNDGTVSLKSFDKEGHYLRHSDYELFCENYNDNQNPEAFHEDATFTIHRDLWHCGFFSFESVNFPGHFIRHQDSRLRISNEFDSDNIDLFHNDASFRTVEGPLKLQSKNFPDHMIGTDGDAGFIKQDGEEFYLVRPGLHGGHGSVSLLPCCGCQDHVMRHFDSELFSENPDDCRNSECVADDASFNLKEDEFEDGYFTLESLNFPGQYVRHSDYRVRIDPDDGSETMHQDSSFRTVQGPHRLRSYNFPEQGIGYDDNNEAYLQDDVKSFYLVSPGLNKQNGTMSFESVDIPGHYFRHCDYTVDLENRQDARNQDSMPDDATFKMKEDLWFDNTVVFESVNFPGHYLRHQDYRLKISEYDGSDVFQQDASFTM